MRTYSRLFGLIIIAIITTCLLFLSSATLSKDNVCVYHQEAYQGVNLSNLSIELEKTGLIGEIHGAVSKEKLYVLSVRDPENFFNFRHFSVIPGNQKAQETLRKVKRHEQVCLKGKLIDNPSRMPHLLVESAKIMESWSGLEGYENYEHKASLPQELREQTRGLFKVHAISNQGEILVVEYLDIIIPVFVQEPELTKDLYRGDLVEIDYKIQSYPDNPTHLRLNLQEENPLKVIDKLVAQQGQLKKMSGNLVKFPKSPQLKFDVYAIEVLTQEIPRYYTLVNFEDLKKFEQIRLKLARIWNDNLSTVKRGRNFLINPNVTIEAQGMINIISPQQANPQILLEDADKIREEKENN